MPGQHWPLNGGGAGTRAPNLSTTGPRHRCSVGWLASDTHLLGGAGLSQGLSFRLADLSEHGRPHDLSACWGLCGCLALGTKKLKQLAPSLLVVSTRMTFLTQMSSLHFVSQPPPPTVASSGHLVSPKGLILLWDGHFNLDSWK